MTMPRIPLTVSPGRANGTADGFLQLGIVTCVESHCDACAAVAPSAASSRTPKSRVASVLMDAPLVGFTDKLKSKGKGLRVGLGRADPPCARLPQVAERGPVPLRGRPKDH